MWLLIVTLSVLFAGCAANHVPSIPEQAAMLRLAIEETGPAFDLSGNLRVTLMPLAEPAWVLIIVTNHNYFHNLRDHPEYEFRAYPTLDDCSHAKRVLDVATEGKMPESGLVPGDLFTWELGQPGSYLECVYEPKENL